MPGLCVIGLSGNLAILIVLVYRLQERVETIERGSLLGMISLAISDGMFCLVTICVVYLMDNRMFYETWNISLFVTMYGHYFQNVFIKVSTGVTVVMSIFRYTAVIHPVTMCQRITGIFRLKMLGLVLAFVLWLLLYIPVLWMWDAQEIRCNGSVSFILLDLGTDLYNPDSLVYQMTTYLYATLGFFIPLSILAYCNIKIIRSLNKKKTVRRTKEREQTTTLIDTTKLHVNESESHANTSNVNSHVRTRERRQASQWQASVTLIGIVLSFFIFTCPSELYNFCVELFPEQFKSWNNALVISNVLQLLNMSLNFLLYCTVNGNFRKTAATLVNVIVRKVHISPCSQKT